MDELLNVRAGLGDEVQDGEVHVDARYGQLIDGSWPRQQRPPVQDTDGRLLLNLNRSASL